MRPLANSSAPPARSKRLLPGVSRVALAAIFALGGAMALAQPQILRPQEAGSAATILQAERLVRFQLELPVEPELAFDAWTEANQLVEWFAHWAEMTVSVGDGFEIGWEGFDGVWQGRYLEIERPERLVFSWLPPESVFPAGAYETRVSLTFDEVEEGRTRLTLEHTGFEGTAELEAQLQAWRPYLFALRAYLLQPRDDS